MSYVNIAPIKYPSPNIFLTADQLQNFSLAPGDTVNVQAGSASVFATVTMAQKGNYISTKVIESLNLPRVKELKLKSEAPKILKVGPLIGIIISRSKKRRRLPPYTSQSKLLRKFLSYSANTKSLAYVFSPDEVDMKHRQISGFYLETGTDGKSTWKRHVFPLPDIIYDRILYRTHEKKKLTQQVISYLLDNKIGYFNPKFLNKWETYAILVKNPELTRHLPYTCKYEHPESFLKFLETFQTVYLKPSNGSLGKDIVRVSRMPDGYRYQYRKRKKTVTGIWHNATELCHEIPKLINSRVFIMQQGLDLVKYNERVFDIRVLMQKDNHGQWVNTATVARVATEGNIFPNVAAGGEPKNIETLWQELTSQDWFSSKTCSLIREVGLCAAKTLESALGTFGEIGLDMGIDGSGNAWIIEINSKPSRKVFPHDQPHLKKTSIKMPIDYAVYLAGFGPDQGRVLH